MATNKNLNSLDKKFKNDKLKFELITNNNLVCKDCSKRYDDTLAPGNTSKCEAFDMKPNEVLDGGDCYEYKNEK